VESEGPAALRQLHGLAANLVRNKTGQWRELVQNGPLAQARHTMEVLDQLEAGNSSSLAAAAVHSAAPTAPEPLFGMCGRLQTWDLTPKG
jgi:hypothetical protein